MILYDNLATLGDIPEAVHDKTEKLEYVVNNSNQKIETLETTIKTIYSKNTHSPNRLCSRGRICTEVARNES